MKEMPLHFKIFNQFNKLFLLCPVVSVFMFIDLFLYKLSNFLRKVPSVNLW